MVDQFGRQTSMIGRVALVFEAFDDLHPKLTLSEVAERAGLPLSSTHRILEQMTSVRWLDRSGDHYQLGLRILELGGLAAHRNRLRAAALPLIQELHAATGQVVHLAMLDGREAVYLEKIGGPFSKKVPTRVGGRQPVHCTGIGKAILAFAGDERIEEILAAGLTARTPYTIVQPSVLRVELARTRERSVSFDREESLIGLGCVAAPIRGAGRAVAGVSICGPISEIDFEKAAPMVRSTAQAIWREAFGPGVAAEPLPAALTRLPA